MEYHIKEDAQPMTAQREVAIMEAAIAKWGEPAQMIVAIEELSELLPPEDILVSVMCQYTPPAEYGRRVAGLPPELMRRVTPEEYELVSDCAAELGFAGFLQDPESADAAYTPEWNEVTE